MVQASDEQWREIAALVSHMATSGEGTDQCLEAGCLPLPVHFYSPVPDLAELDRRQVWTRISPLRGVDMRPEQQAALLLEMARAYAPECRWAEHPVEGSPDFHWRNPSFSFQCASLLHYMVRARRPRRIIEVGSGMSSRVISRAIGMNARDHGITCDYRIVDPYPSAFTRALPGLSSVHDLKVEELEPAFFQELGPNDLLFIDSSHTVKIGGDVNFLVLDVLPVLAPGVAVHFHDIGLPFEYARAYYTTPTFRMLWAEAYLLQAFLMFNSEFEVLVSVPYLLHHSSNLLDEAFPGDPKNTGSGSFWLRRKVRD